MSMPYSTKAKLVTLVLPLLIILPFTLFALRATHTISAASPVAPGISLAVTKSSYQTGETVTALLANGTDKDIFVANNCPYQPFAVYKQVSGSWKNINAAADSSKCAGEPRAYAVPAGRSVPISYKFWPTLFNSPGTYKIVANIDGQLSAQSVSFTIE